MRKAITKRQQSAHEYLTGALLLSPVVGLGFGLWLYYSAHWIVMPHALLWGLLIPVVVLLFWLDTEVNWRKREARFSKMVARITGN